MRRLAATVTLLALTVLAGCQAPARGDTATPPGRGAARATPNDVKTPQASPRPDPASDVLGWENGRWHDDPLNVTVEDGLNASELNAVVNRSMARVEYLRRLEFDRRIPVEIISRVEFRRDNPFGGGRSGAFRTFVDARYEALFLVGEDAGSTDTRQNNTISNVLGFYAPAKDRITIVSATATPGIAEGTLAHELLHALQYGHFEMGELRGRTLDENKAKTAVVEGDASLLEHRYRQRCGSQWRCITPQPSNDTGGEDGSGSGLHWGVYMLQYFPYSDGPAFVRHVWREGGWDAVAELYTDPPASTEQVIVPEKYPADEPRDVTLHDRSDDDWRRVTPSGYREPYETLGQAAIATMFAYPAYDDSRPSTTVIRRRAFLNFDGGRVSRFDPYNYDVRYASGWDGDKLWVYRNDSGATGYVWRLVWDSTRDARQFVQGYRRLLSYWRANRLGDGRWRIPEGANGFADAFSVSRSGKTVTIVNAPTVAQLDDIHDGSS